MLETDVCREVPAGPSVVPAAEAIIIEDNALEAETWREVLASAIEAIEVKFVTVRVGDKAPSSLAGVGVDRNVAAISWGRVMAGAIDVGAPPAFVAAAVLPFCSFVPIIDAAMLDSLLTTAAAESELPNSTLDAPAMPARITPLGNGVSVVICTAPPEFNTPGKTTTGVATTVDRVIEKTWPGEPGIDAGLAPLESLLSLGTEKMTVSGLPPTVVMRVLNDPVKMVGAPELATATASVELGKGAPVTEFLINETLSVSGCGVELLVSLAMEKMIISGLPLAFVKTPVLNGPGEEAAD